tara:strand:+ start:3725 stop:4114 length:390 start_codon:yes stop_codon:yes gene_type:complete
MSYTESYNLFVVNYYDNLSKNYYKIVSINKIPKGELSKYIKKISIKNISTDNERNTEYCSYVISSSILNNNNNILNICTINDINEIYEFLINNNYSINNELNKCLKLNDNLKIFNNKKLLFSIYLKIEI